MRKHVTDWAWNVLVAFDRLVNSILGGDPDVTLSARMGAHLQDSQDSDCKQCVYISTKICYILDLIDPDHCRTSAERYYNGKSKSDRDT